MPFTFSLALSILALAAFASGNEERVLKVTATAYNSLPGQTQDNPALTAWALNLSDIE